MPSKCKAVNCFVNIPLRYPNGFSVIAIIEITEKFMTPECSHIAIFAVIL